MATYQISWNSTSKVATIQTNGDAIPGNSTKLGTFVHDDAQDNLDIAENHVLYHHVRDALYKVGHTDMAIVQIDWDKVYVALVSIAITPATTTLATGATLDLNVTPTPGNASNGNVTWTTSNPARATVNAATGLVTGVSAGAVTITATSQDGAKTATRNLTIT